MGWLLATLAFAQRQSSTTTCSTTTLNRVLATYQVYVNNLHAFHWHVRGPHFFVLHEAYEQMYDRGHEAMDGIAARIMALVATPVHTFGDYLV